jgi:hypothetical protein
MVPHGKLMEGSNCPALRRQERHQELLLASGMAKSATAAIVVQGKDG